MICIGQRVIGAMVVCTAAVAAQGPTPTFRSEARLVTVNASIELGRRPLPNLTAADFVVRDNGIQQNLLQVSYEIVPLDVTVIVDISGGSVSGVKALERDAQRVVSFLQPTERLRILAIDTYVHELVPMSPVRTMTVRPAGPSGGWSAVHDSIAAALLVSPEPGRRRLVVVLTDGLDNVSGTSAERLVQIARATDSVLLIVQARLGMPSVDPGRTKLPYPIGNPNLQALEEAATVTGGEMFRESGNGRFETIERLIELFRQSYVLRYIPTGVEPNGWHEIEVRVRGQRDVTVRARRGYFGG